jgi:hypothetical protein
MDLWVFIYSKFSSRCNQLIELISSNDIDIQFTMLCIDDKSMRNRIINNKDLNVQYVPCILQINQLTGVVSKYEADKAFELVYSIIESLNEQIEPTPPPVQAQTPPQTQAKIAPVARTNIQEEEDNETIIPTNSAPPTNSGHTMLDLDEIDIISPPSPPPNSLSEHNPIKKRIKASDVMAKAEKDNPNIAVPSYNSAGFDLAAGPPPPIKSVKSGGPISVSAIMARAKEEANKE